MLALLAENAVPASQFPAPAAASSRELALLSVLAPNLGPAPALRLTASAAERELRRVAAQVIKSCHGSVQWCGLQGRAGLLSPPAQGED